MAKTVMTIKISSQADIISKMRRTAGIDGTLNGGTKVQSNKGKRVYNRNRFNNPKNW